MGPATRAKSRPRSRHAARGDGRPPPIPSRGSAANSELDRPLPTSSSGRARSRLRAFHRNKRRSTAAILAVSFMTPPGGHAVDGDDGHADRRGSEVEKNAGRRYPATGKVSGRPSTGVKRTPLYAPTRPSPGRNGITPAIGSQPAASPASPMPAASPGDSPAGSSRPDLIDSNIPLRRISRRLRSVGHPTWPRLPLVTSALRRRRRCQAPDHASQKLHAVDHTIRNGTW